MRPAVPCTSTVPALRGLQHCSDAVTASNNCWMVQLRAAQHAAPPEPGHVPERSQCFGAADFHIGATINVFGRSFLIHSCDEFTRAWLQVQCLLQEGGRCLDLPNVLSSQGSCGCRPSWAGALRRLRRLMSARQSICRPRGSCRRTTALGPRRTPPRTASAWCACRSFCSACALRGCHLMCACWRMRRCPRRRGRISPASWSRRALCCALPAACARPAPPAWRLQTCANTSSSLQCM